MPLPLAFLFGVIEGYVAALGSTDADGVFDGDDEDTSVADFSGLCSLDDGLYRFLCILVAYDNRDKYSFDGAGVIDYATICLLYTSDAADEQ